MNVWCCRCSKLTEHDRLTAGIPYGNKGHSVRGRCTVCGKRQRDGWVVPGRTAEEALAWVKAQENAGTP